MERPGRTVIRYLILMPQGSRIAGWDTSLPGTAERHLDNRRITTVKWPPPSDLLTTTVHELLVRIDFFNKPM